WRARFGGMPAPPGPVTELRVRPAPRVALFERLEPEILIRDRLAVATVPPPDSDPLVTVPWRFGEVAAGFRLQIGRGRLLHLGLGWEPGLYGDDQGRRLLHRCLRSAAGLAPGPAIGVGLYGYGAIGREHAAAVQAVPGFELRGVCDRAPPRRAEAEGRFATPVHESSESLLADPDVGLVIVGVPPSLHVRAVLECLEAGRHVVCEKPFALRSAEVDGMLAAARPAERTLTVYQSRRWDPDFIALRDAMRRGAIGQPFYMESFIGGYGHPCDYWHSHEPVSGGTIYDWGSHYFDWLLQLFPGEVTAVTAHSVKRVWHDVTNADQVRVDLTFAGGEQAMFLQSDVAAALKPKWYVLGTEGAAVGDWRREVVTRRAWTGDLVEEALQPAEAPAAVSLHRPDGAGGVHVESLALRPRAAHGFYRDLGDHLLLGEPLAVQPEQAGRNVAVMEAATRSVAEGGRRLSVRL
ncbi:MAG: Gfo/Idh/MocA family oxidoreductase, partial [Candidatus Dormibacteraeota bacterium]|nr:Gfo/Idh/MocA family oxidoreductase [Candidatus Dormibacteraeota bacterium]